MTSRRDRIFAWVGVVVAGLSAVALSVAVVIQQVTDRTNAGQSAADTQAAQAAAQCASDSQTETALSPPKAYKPSGAVTALQTTDLTIGSGAAAKQGDCLIVKYYGTLASDGKKFDENFTQPTGLAFTLGEGQVIPGWDQGLEGIKAGGTRRLVIPASLAYGDQSPSADIPANSALVFVVKLLRIQQP